MTSPFHALPGAVGDPVPQHYGSPVQEQRALEAGDAIVDLSHRGVITVRGADRLSWLNSMTSQLLLGLRPGESVETLLLDPNGRIEHAIRLVDDGETAWLLVDEGSAEALTDHLMRMRFALRVEVADASDEFATVLAFDGGAAVPALAALAPAATWADPWASVVPGGVQYAHGKHPGAAWNAVQFVLPREALASSLAELMSSPVAPVSSPVETVGSIRPAGLMALDALEICAWRPSRAGDVDERAIPHEYDWLRTAVHLDKGCYRGQETVAKVHNLGHPPRRLALLHLDGFGGELPEPGALVFLAGEAGLAEARPVGRVTRAALHHEWGGIALALLKRSVAEDAALEVRVADGAVAAAQEAIVPADAGATRRERIASQFSARRS